nr:hypothetical protein K-LCC10_0356 [Kaumoebavirus]
MDLPAELCLLIFEFVGDPKLLRRICKDFHAMLPTRVHRYKGPSLDHYAFLTTCADIPVIHREVRPNLTLTHYFDNGKVVSAVIRHKKRTYFCEVRRAPKNFRTCVIHAGASLEYFCITDGTLLVIESNNHLRLIHNDLITFYV